MFHIKSKPGYNNEQVFVENYDYLPNGHTRGRHQLAIKAAYDKSNSTDRGVTVQRQVSHLPSKKAFMNNMNACLCLVEWVSEFMDLSYVG